MESGLRMAGEVLVLTALAAIVVYTLAMAAVMLATVLGCRRRDALGEELDRFLDEVLGRPGRASRASAVRRAWRPVVTGRSRRSVPCGDPR